MPSELDPAFANYMPPRRRETPTEGMKRIELEMRDRPNTNPGRITTGAGRTIEGYNASIGAQGPVGGGVMVAADPITGQPVMVGGRAQAGPLSYQYNKPTFKGAPASQQIGVGGQPFDADTYFGVTAQQSPGQGRTYGANVSQSGEDGGWSAYGGYNPTTKGVNVGGSYTANFSDGGRAVVGHTTAAGEPVSLEEHKGEIRHRQDSGNSRMAADYGYIDTSKPDHDGMKTDAFVGPHRDSKKVFVVNQQHPRTGKFNEHKVLLGYKDRAHALRDYVHSFSDGLGHKRIQSVVEMGTHELKDWLKKDHTAPLRKAEGGPVDEPRPLTIRRSEVPKAAEAQDGALRDEDTYGPTNLEERKARIQEMTTPTDYPGDKLEAPQGYITPATAVEWKLGDAGPYAVDAEGKTLPLIKQPGVLPLYRDPTVDSIRPAMPALVDIAGNVMGAPAGITAARTIQAAAAGERPLANVVSAMGAGEKATAQVVKDAEGAEKGAAKAAERELSSMGLYSHAAEVADALPQAKGSPQQMKAMLKGVKQEELAGFDEAFAGQKSVTKDEIAQHFRDQMPVVEETVLGKHARPEDVKNYFGLDDKAFDELTPQEFLQMKTTYLNAHGESSPTKFGQYTLPGGENYREVLLKLPEGYGAPKQALDDLAAARQRFKDLDKRHTDELHAGLTGDMNMSYEDFDKLTRDRDIAESRVKNFEKLANQPAFQSGHWQDPNVLAHLRMADRTGPNGEKILHVEEIQSDWGQKGKKEGFVDPQDKANMPSLIKQYDELNAQRHDFDRMIRYGDDADPAIQKAVAQRVDVDNQMQALSDRMTAVRSNIPAGPYVTKTEAWTDLALKRALKEAAEGGYDKLVWTPGAEQAKRYSLSNQVDRLQYIKNDNGTYAVIPYKDGTPLHQIERDNIPDKELDALFGRDVAAKMRAYEGDVDGNARSLAGQNLEVGGSGMKGYYDKIVPTQLSKLVKKLDPEARIGQSEIPGSGKKTYAPIPDHFFQYTEDVPALRGATDLERSNWWDSQTKQERKRIKDEWIAKRQYEPNVAAHSLDITPKMRESILKGQTAFAEGGEVEAPAQGGAVTPASATQQVANVAHDLASIAHKDHLDQRHLAYLLKVASGMYMPPERAMQFAGQIMTGDVPGLIQRFRTYVPSMRTFARLNEMMGGKHKFMGSGHMGKQMQRMKGVDGLDRMKQHVEGIMDSDVVKARPVMAKALKKISKRI